MTRDCRCGSCRRRAIRRKMRRSVDPASRFGCRAHQGLSWCEGLVTMRGLSRLSTLLIFCAICFGQANEDRKLVSGRFPDREDLAILCWSVPDADGYLSQILVFRNDGQGKARVLWESPLDYAYSPQIQFVRDITVEGVPLALVERQ